MWSTNRQERTLWQVAAFDRKKSPLVEGNAERRAVLGRTTVVVGAAEEAQGVFILVVA